MNIETETKPSESRRKHLKSSIVSVIDKLGFTLTNPEMCVAAGITTDTSLIIPPFSVHPI